MKQWALTLMASILWTGIALSQEDYSFDLSEIEPKPWEVGGYVEFQPFLYNLNKEAAFYKLNAYNRDEGPYRDQYNMAALVESRYQKGITELHAIVNMDLQKESHWSDQTTLYEGSATLRPSPNFNFSLGKTTLKWGKGYAWNPVAFLDRPKDPLDPDLAREGRVIASVNYIKSFEGPLQTFSFTPVLIPVCDDLNRDFAQAKGLNVAGKIYLLWYDTDIDFMILTGDSKTTRYGMDFSRNITSNFEVHGEIAFIKKHTKKTLDSIGVLHTQNRNAFNHLWGIRYLTATETTFILEYYHNDTGYTPHEMQDFYSYIDQSYNTFVTSDDRSALDRTSNITRDTYSRRNPMKDYLYLRVSQKEPFDFLYFTPSVTSLWNLNDNSVSVGPEFLYTGIENLELRLRTTFLLGSTHTEYGEKPNNSWIGLRARYYY